MHMVKYFELLLAWKHRIKRENFDPAVCVYVCMYALMHMYVYIRIE
jgi:hypothetical protein